jgi:hypothetical protein
VPTEDDELVVSVIVPTVLTFPPPPVLIESPGSAAHAIIQHAEAKPAKSSARKDVRIRTSVYLGMG